MKFAKLFVLLSALVVLTSCGGGGGSGGGANVPLPLMVDSWGRTVQENDFGGGDGAAAGGDGGVGSGAPIVGATVTVSDNAGHSATGISDGLGYFRVSLKGFTPPFIAKATKDGYPTWHSPSITPVKTRGFVTLNLSGLTDYVASEAARAAGKNSSADLTPALLALHPESLATAKTTLNTLLKAQIIAVGLDPATFDPVTALLIPNSHTSYDKLLDDVVVTNAPNGPTVVETKYSLGGSISGLGGQVGLSLRNGSETLHIPANASSFTFYYLIAKGESYQVQIAGQPSGQSCAVHNGEGVMGSASLTNVTVVCGLPPQSLGGTVSGLSTSGLILINGGETLQVAANAPTFTFANPIAQGAPYAVSVQTQPNGASCNVVNGTGTAGSTAITTVAVKCTPGSYTLGGSVSGLSVSGLVLANGSPSLQVAANTPLWSFPDAIASGTPYNVTVLTQPAQATCRVDNGTGAIGNSAVTSVVVTCTTNQYTLGGSIKGLTGSGLLLSATGQGMTVSAGSMSFTFPKPFPAGTNYGISIQTQPLGQTCTVSDSGPGVISTANVTSLVVSCSDVSYLLGGTITGLSGSGLVLAGGGQTVTRPAGSTSFQFQDGIASGTPYSVTVVTQPVGQTCSVSSGSGTGYSGIVNSVLVACIPNQFRLSGTINNLTGSGLVLATGGQTATPSANDTSFEFATRLSSGAPYNVTVQTQPVGQSCTVSNGTGTMSGTVNSVVVTCASLPSYTLGGSVTGIGFGTDVVLASNGQTITATGPGHIVCVAFPCPQPDGTFTFPTALPSGTYYSVTVQTDPAGYTCAVLNGSGYIANTNVTNVAVSCVANISYTLGGTVSGLAVSNYGLVLAVTALVGQAVPVYPPYCPVGSCVANFTFPYAEPFGSIYSVTVQTQPAGRTCTVLNGSGVMPNANVTNVAVTCVAVLN